MHIFSLIVERRILFCKVRPGVFSWMEGETQTRQLEWDILVYLLSELCITKLKAFNIANCAICSYPACCEQSDIVSAICR
jgi:hypothetical protein